jgi:hypothetical protein
MKSFTVTVTKTYTPQWSRFPFTTYGEVFRTIRKDFRYKGDSCFKCNRHFNDNEEVGLAAFVNVGNKMMCKTCIEEIS